MSSGRAWLPVEQTLPSNKKTLRVARLLGVPPVPNIVGHLVTLWLWAVDNVPDGKLSDLDPQEVALACNYQGDATAFVAALREAELLDADGRINDWDEYAKRLVDMRSANARRMREARARAKEDRVHARAAHVRDTVQVRAGATEQNTPTNVGADAPDGITEDAATLTEWRENALASVGAAPTPNEARKVLAAIYKRVFGKVPTSFYGRVGRMQAKYGASNIANAIFRAGMLNPDVPLDYIAGTLKRQSELSESEGAAPTPSTYSPPPSLDEQEARLRG